MLSEIWADAVSPGDMQCTSSADAVVQACGAVLQSDEPATNDNAERAVPEGERQGGPRIRPHVGDIFYSVEFDDLLYRSNIASVRKLTGVARSRARARAVAIRSLRAVLRAGLFFLQLPFYSV